MIAFPTLDISDLDSKAKAKIAENSELLHGISLDEDGPRASSKKVARFKDDTQKLFHAPKTSAEIQVFSTSSEYDAVYIREGWSKKALSTGQLCSIVTPDSRLTSTVSDPVQDTLYLFGRFQIPCISVQIDAQSLAPSEAFAQAITAALMQPDDAARLQELQVVLSRFGTVVATRFEMGLSLCTTEKMIFKSKETQLDEEKNLKVQLLRLLHGTVKDPNVSLDTLHVYTRGGKSSILPGLDITSWLSTVQDPANWVVIGVSSVVSTLSFLDEPRKSAVQALLASISSSQVQRLVPVFHFPGRFTEWWTADGDRRTGTGYVDVPLSVRLSESFTVSAWVRRGGPDHWRCFLSIESPHFSCSLLWLGNFHGKRHFTALYSCELNKDARGALDSKTSIPCDGLTWMHVAFVYQWGAQGKVNECLLYVNGHKEAARSLTTPLVHIDGIRLVLGRGMWDHKRDHAWDDQIEDVKVFQQALSEAEITDEAKKSNEPKASAAFKSAGGFMAF